MAFLSGPYFWSFGPRDHVFTNPPTQAQIDAFGLGVVEDAPTFRFSREGDPITGDNLGAAIQGVVDRGGNLFIDMVLQELNGNAPLRAWWPYDPSNLDSDPDLQDILPDQLGRIGTFTQRTIGRLTPVQELRGTKILNSGELDDVDPPGVGRLLHNLHFDNAQLAPGFDITQLLGSRLRNVPISFLCSPFISGSGSNAETVYWTQS